MAFIASLFYGIFPFSVLFFFSFDNLDFTRQKKFHFAWQISISCLKSRMQWKFQKILKEFWLQVLSEKKLAWRLQYSRYRPTVLWDNLGNVLPTLKRSSKFLAFLIVLSWSRNQSLLRHTNKKENIVILLAAFLVGIPLRFLKNSMFICLLRQKNCTVVLWHFWSEK